jgi:hypothetical protein
LTGFQGKPMSTVTLELLDELIERAKSVGIELESQTNQIIALLDAQIRRRAAAHALQDVARQLQALPAQLKPTQDKIDAEIRAYWAEQAGDNDGVQ